MPGKPRTVDEKIAAIANRDHGVATRKELLDAGLREWAIEARVARGSLLPVFRGVYRVGHKAPSTNATYMAAVKACGEKAFLSGPPAAHLLRLLKGAAPPPEVTAPTERRIEAIKVRRCRKLDARDTTTCRGIPVTSVARTLVDLAGVLTRDELARACHEAGVRYGTTPAEVDAALARCPNARGAAKLKAILHGDVHVTLSRLEKRFLRLLRKHRLPLPETNRPAGSHRVDCRWPERRLSV